MDDNQASVATTRQNDVKTPDAGIEKWFQRLKASEKYMQVEFKPRYVLARRRLRSEYQVIFTQGRYPTHNQVNLVYSIGSNFVNSVLFKSPEINLTAREEEETEKVENTEVEINDIIRDKKIKRTVKRALWDAYLGGFGCIYIDYEYDDMPSGEPIMDEGGNPIMDEMGEPMQKRVILKNNIVIRRVRPELLRIPRGFNFDTFQESPWIGFDVILPLEDVRADKRFDPAVVEKVKGAYYDDVADREFPKYASQYEKDDVMYVKLHYIFERPINPGEPFKLLVLTDETTHKPLMVTEYDKGHVGYPIKFIYFNPVDDDNAYPCGDPWLWESQLHAVDKYWIRMLNHTKRLNRKYIYDVKDIEKTEIQNIKSNEDMEYVGLKNRQNKPLESLLTGVPDLPVTGDNHTFFGMARGLLSELGPKSALTRGSVDQETKTATQAQIMAQAEAVDLDARIDDIREFWIDIVLDVAGILQKSYVGYKALSGKLPNGKEISRTVGKEGFTTKVNVDVDVESMQHPNKDVFRRQLIDIIGQLKMVEPELNKIGKGINFEFFIKKLFENMTIRNSDDALIDLNIPNPQMEHENLVFGKVPPRVHPQENLDEHLQGHMRVLNDQIASAMYEKMQPGFTQVLQQHILETQTAVSGRQQAGVMKQADTPTGERPMQATEQQRASKV